MLKGHCSQKGQVVIPSEIRKELKIVGGTAVAFTVKGASVLLTPITAELADRYMGVFGADPDASKRSIEDRRVDEGRTADKFRRAGYK
jgi:AbrB family looped-hinge helix DNA binding protein